MSFSELNATGYNYNQQNYITEFENVLSKIVLCYNLMLNDSVILSNDENSIRDILLLKYLKNNEVRRKIELTDFLFDREVPEDNSIGRTDIKIQTTNTFEDTSAYYTIECKRLDSENVNGVTGLNAKYIKDGICRFASKTYSSYYKVNGMIGFVVKALNINQNIESLNSLLKNSFSETNTVKFIALCQIIPDFEYCYSSTHTVGKIEIIIYHLMFDFSKNI